MSQVKKFLTKPILAPPCGVAALRTEARSRVKVVRKACRVDVRSQDERLGQVDDGEIILEIG